MTTQFRKNLSSPDETRTFEKGSVELATLSGVTFGRVTLHPGWKWSQHVKPIVKTESCLAPHTQYIISGKLHIAMDDGTNFDLGPGDATVIPPGHDAWVVGNESVIAIDVTGMTHYAEQPMAKAKKAAAR